ncbi:MAG TPA: universal stress protein [Kofleriaceae bacterium]|jgi:nucleotide-binding universal stress UspA family protein
MPPIICGTDLSAASAAAMSVACAIATQRGDTDVIAVHVIDEDGDARKARADLDAHIRGANVGAHVRGELVIGPADSTLITFAETEASDLIVIAASSKGTDLGTTAERVVATTRVPVLMVRDPEPLLRFAKGERAMRVLVGVDETIACELCLQWTHALRRRGPVDVIVGAVYYPDDAAQHYGLTAGTLVDRDPEIERLLSRDLLRRFGSSERAIARVRRGLGRIGDHVVELANEEHAEVIVVGTSQRTGLDRMGSVSSVIVQSAPQSVVCVPPNAAVPTIVAPTWQSALVATDLSQFANRAAAYAFAAIPAGGTVHLAHVVEEDAKVDETAISRELLALAPTDGNREVLAHVVRGDDAATAIAQCAARLGTDVICIATHGRSGLTRAIMGSVADKLMRATRKPVLVLRPG